MKIVTSLGPDGWTKWRHSADPSKIDGAAIAVNSMPGDRIVDASLDASRKLMDGSINTPKLADGAVTTPKIADVNVTDPKISKKIGTESAVSVAAGGTYAIPAGIYYVVLGANTSVQYTPDRGTTWRTVIPAGHGGLVVSDGTSFRLYNAGTAAETSYLLQVVR